VAWISASKDGIRTVLATSKRTSNHQPPSFSKVAVEFDEPLRALTSVHGFSQRRDQEGHSFKFHMPQFDHFRSTVFLFDGMYMSIGCIDQRLWMCVGELRPDTKADPYAINKALNFPFGMIWQNNEFWDSIYFLGEEIPDMRIEDGRKARRCWSTSNGDYLLDFNISSSELRTTDSIFVSSELKISCSLANPNDEVFECGNILNKGPTYPIMFQ
jgi:hypothetical protein